MSLEQMIAAGNPGEIGEAMHRLVAELYPICRSITGQGVRQTLQRVAREVPLEIREVPTGTPAFDWTVPREWNIRGAWIQGPDGRRLVDFADCNLHVVSYSVPVRRRLSLSELRPHLFSLPEHPDWIPYRTAYYSETWGFCLPHRLLEALPDGEYEVCIDSTLAPGHLTYGELLIPGDSPEEVLLSCHICHPSLANDNLSGIALATFLAGLLRRREPRRYSYRFLFVPGTIGSITWLAANRKAADRVRHGLVITCVGDPGPATYKRSRRGDAEIDRAAVHVLAHSGKPHEVLDFVPFGYDERQYCSPGFNLPVGSLMRSPNGRYPEYHTSADNLELVSAGALAESLELYARVLDVLEGNHVYQNRHPFCEPQLGKRGLYQAVGGGPEGRDRQLALLWVLNLSDGGHSLLDIAERSGLSFPLIRAAATALEEKELLQPCPV